MTMFKIALYRDAFLTLKRNEPLTLAGATSFFATFSVSPIIVILVNVLGLYFKNDEIRKQLIARLEEMFGPETSRYIEGIVKAVNSTQRDWLVGIAGFIFLLFVATTLLKVVKQAIHKIWQIKRKHVSHLKYNFKERAVAVAVLMITGIIVGGSMILDTSLSLISSYLREELPGGRVFLIRAINLLFSIGIGTLWFAILFKVLPDARVHWKISFAGGFLTALLFSAGKWILGKLLLYDTLANIFGPSASFVIILLFIFYSSMILYYGAAFTHVYAAHKGKPVQPGKYTEEYEFRPLAAEANDNPNDL
jgi:membrane protein